MIHNQPDRAMFCGANKAIYRPLDSTKFFRFNSKSQLLFVAVRVLMSTTHRLYTTELQIMSTPPEIKKMHDLYAAECHRLYHHPIVASSVLLSGAGQRSLFSESESSETIIQLSVSIPDKSQNPQEVSTLEPSHKSSAGDKVATKATRDRNEDIKCQILNCKWNVLNLLF